MFYERAMKSLAVPKTMVLQRLRRLGFAYHRQRLHSAVCAPSLRDGVNCVVVSYNFRRPASTSYCDDRKCRSTSTVYSLAKGIPPRRVRAFYLRPDVDELALLKEMSNTGNDEPVNVAWGEELPAAEVVDVLIAQYPSAEELDALAPDLQSVVVPFAGPTAATTQLLRKRPYLSLHNCHFNAASTAELAIALVLAATKQVLQKDQRFRSEARAAVSTKRPWTAGWEDRPTFNSKTLAKRRALVLGLGAIGTRVACVLSALGMEVHAVRRRVPPVGEGTGPKLHDGTQIHNIEKLHSLLSLSEVVVVCLPGTSATEGLIASRELSCIPQGSVLVNVGRGSVVDEDALFQALRDGHLGAAGLDVWFNYPMLPGQGLGKELPIFGPSRYPFHELPNVVMTPHVGQCSVSKAEDRMLELKTMLRTMSETGSLPNRFDMDAGY
eukprot:TRINITY_DN77769_c0_g1_i1.p1 TRINITY_DN77769_c0_g1~~TRINITY_DN77769_c0_g1_i1.p1  ORF type:complete len:438 (-),score=61.49 TRINITY_DN77769_c0_g1_i1:203-1516(-)